ncbi:MAG: hypothetical protein UW70_C0106G0007 [Candidatus Peregrinibacteria bacterium GW2011_GWA2_44_7]|nr:MAG: hypothetical protein UW70_C0106G0007 [Candidatus Peregrinibacteria bacterium GW2011_GWA2_44_7]
MGTGVPGKPDNPRTKQFYYGTRADLKPGDLIEPNMTTYVYLTPNLDAAIWEAELAEGEGPGRVYTVEPIGQMEDAYSNKVPSGTTPVKTE